MKKVVILLSLSFLFILPNVWAEEGGDDVWTAAQSEVYGTKAGGMLGRGVLNVATCFVDVIVHTVEGTKQGPPLVGTLTGLGSGIACTALRVTSGALDIVTFWVPGFNGIPVTKNYKNCLEEETEEFEVQPQEMAPARSPEEYAKPAEPKKKHDTLDYVKK